MRGDPEDGVFPWYRVRRGRVSGVPVGSGEEEGAVV